MKKGAAIFSILMGVTMFGTWLFLFISGGVPQVRTLPVETGYLLTAEFLTASALVVGGYGVLSRQKWAMPLLLVALGQLIYCVIRYAGELGQEGSWAGLAFFTVAGAAGLVFAVGLVIGASRWSSFS